MVQVKVKSDKESGERTDIEAAEKAANIDQEMAEPEEKDDSEREKRPEEKEKPLEALKKSELIEKIREVREEADKNHDLYLRSQAEMDNMKKRFQREKGDLIKFSNDNLIKQLLPVVDSLEKAISHSNEGNAFDALRKGVELTLKGLMDTLEKSGLEEIKALGEAFDPNFHEAVSELVNNEVEPKTVIEELQKGYLLNKRLLRPSMVVLSKNSQE